MKGDDSIFDKNRKKALDERSRLNHPSMPKVINRLADTELQIGDRNRAYIQDISEKTGKPFYKVLNTIIAEHEENSIFKGMKACYTELRQDEGAWQKHLEERGNPQINLDNLENE